MKLVVAGRRFPGLASSARNGGNSVRRPCCSDLEHPDRGRQIPQPSRPQIDQINAAEQTRRRLGQQDLTAMPGGHHPRRTIQHRTEVVARHAARLRRSPAPSAPATPAPAARPPPHPPQTCGEANAAHTPSPVCLNNQPPCASIAERNTSSWAASAARIAIGVGLPPTGRTLDIGEQKRHHPRRRGARTPAESHNRHAPTSRFTGIRL